MPSIFFNTKFEHQLYHLVVTLLSLGTSLVWMQNSKNWCKIGNISTCLLLYIIVFGEVLKVLLARFYGNYRKDTQAELMQRLIVNTKLTQFWGVLVVHVIAMLVYTFGCVALGASQINHFQQTCIISLVLTLLTVTQIVLLLGGDGLLSVIFCEPFKKTPTKAEFTAIDLVKYNAVGGMLGAWIGSVIGITNGWAEAWLSYPIPNVFGILAGAALTNVYGLLLILTKICLKYLQVQKSL